MRFLQCLVIPIVAVVVSVAPAEAVTIRDLIELSRAGLGDEVLIELIAVDGSVFNLDAATIRELKASGVSEKVILAMLRAGRAPLPPAPVFERSDPPDITVDVPPPTIIVQQSPPVVVNVPVPVPYFVPVAVRDHGRRHRAVVDHHHDTTPAPGRFINDGFRPSSMPHGNVEAILHLPKKTCWGNVCW